MNNKRHERPWSQLCSRHHESAKYIIGMHADIVGCFDQLSMSKVSSFTFSTSACVAVIAGGPCLSIDESFNAVFLHITSVSAGSYDRFLNLQIALIISMQLLMCLFCSVASYIWREHSGKERYYLGMNEYVQVNQQLLCMTCSLVGSHVL